MLKKILLISAIAMSCIQANNDNRTMDIKMKVWDLNSLSNKELQTKDKALVKQWFLDRNSKFILVDNMKERNVLRKYALPYNSIYFNTNKGWAQFLRADSFSEQIKIKKLTYPDTQKVFGKGLNMFMLNRDIVIAYVDFSKNGFSKMKYFYNYVIPYYKKSAKLKRENFILVGDIIIKDSKDYKKLKKYFKFFISEGNKIVKEDGKYKLIGSKDVVVPIKSKRVVKAYVDYSFRATEKFGKKNIKNYLNNISQEYPINFNFTLKKNK